MRHAIRRGFCLCSAVCALAALCVGAVAHAADSPFVLSEPGDKSVKLTDNGRDVLVYNFGVITNDRVPQTDHRRSRSCYVHPLWGLNGEVLTDDFPADHYHHHGVFWTWPHVAIGGKEHDLWAGDTIRQQFVRWIERETKADEATIACENVWLVGDQKVMREEVRICAHRADAQSRAIDFHCVWTPLDKPITLRGAEGKSYGGFTVRFKPGDRKDTLVTVPSGPTEDDLSETPLAWADFTSRFAGAPGRSGAAVFVAPNHPDYPPTWLTRYYGPLCVGYPGVKGKTFQPGEAIKADYRIWIHKNVVDQKQLAAAYESYSQGIKRGK